MTLTKAAPNDWAEWFATVTGMPLEYVRENLGNPAENAEQVTAATLDIEGAI